MRRSSSVGELEAVATCMRTAERPRVIAAWLPTREASATERSMSPTEKSRMYSGAPDKARSHHNLAP
jgi:hypothetical protein